MKMLANFLMAICLALFSLTVSAETVDINTATAAQLDKALPGIGPKKAADIVKYREANGPFKSVDDLAKVKGIKGKTLDKIKPLVTVGGAPSMPSMPSMPSVPSMPSKPAMPSVPAMPTKPTVPGVPVAPTKP
ncbi:MAG: helix-hairpin-helix domain-containing protein [Candidatus Competibacteraceae bacterium]